MGKLVLQKHQERIVRCFKQCSTQKCAVIFAHGTGTGKTCGSIAAAAVASSEGKIDVLLITTPKAVVSQFAKDLYSNCNSFALSEQHAQATVEKFKTGAKPVSQESHLTYKSGHEMNIIIVTHATIDKLETKRRILNKLQGKRIFLIVDEAHLRRTPGVNKPSQTDNFYNNLCALKINGALFLTATPIYNDPFDLVFLMHQIHRLVYGTGLEYFNFDDPTAFRNYYWDKNGVMDAIRFKEMTDNIRRYNLISVITEPRSEKDYAKELPPKFVLVPLNKAQIDKIENLVSDPFLVDSRRFMNIAPPGHKSPKLEKIADDLGQRTHGGRVSIIYSNFLETLEHLEGVLRDRGWEALKLTVKQKRVLDKLDGVIPTLKPVEGLKSSKVRKVYFHAKKGATSKNINYAIKVLSALDNKCGDYISTILISSKSATGTDFKNVRDVYIVEPHFHDPKLAQVRGRALRKGAHVAFRGNEKEYNVCYRYYLGITPGKPSSDCIIYRMLKKKLKEAKAFEKWMKYTSIEENKMEFDVKKLVGQNREAPKKHERKKPNPRCKHLKIKKLSKQGVLHVKRCKLKGSPMCHLHSDDYKRDKDKPPTPTTEYRFDSVIFGTASEVSKKSIADANKAYLQTLPAHHQQRIEKEDAAKKNKAAKRNTATKKSAAVHKLDAAPVLKTGNRKQQTHIFKTLPEGKRVLALIKKRRIYNEKVDKGRGKEISKEVIARRRRQDKDDYKKAYFEALAQKNLMRKRVMKEAYVPVDRL